MQVSRRTPSRPPRTVVGLLACWLGLLLNAPAAPPPVITVHPTNQTVLPGGTATSYVEATNSSFRVEFFANSAPDDTGYGEGQRYLGFANLTTGGAGNAKCHTTLTVAVAVGEFVSATATKSNPGFTSITDTSEFAKDVTAIPPANGTLTNPVASTSASTDQVPSSNDGSAAAAKVVTVVFPPALLTGRRFPGDAFAMELNTLPNVTCTFLASTNLVDWVTLVTTNTGSGFVQFIDQDVLLHPQRFCRSLQKP